jgi:hypothetical protein
MKSRDGEKLERDREEIFPSPHLFFSLSLSLRLYFLYPCIFYNTCAQNMRENLYLSSPKKAKHESLLFFVNVYIFYIVSLSLSLSLAFSSDGGSLVCECERV